MAAALRLRPQGLSGGGQRRDRRDRRRTAVQLDQDPVRGTDPDRACGAAALDRRLNRWAG